MKKAAWAMHSRQRQNISGLCCFIVTRKLPQKHQMRKPPTLPSTRFPRLSQHQENPPRGAARWVQQQGGGRWRIPRCPPRRRRNSQRPPCCGSPWRPLRCPPRRRPAPGMSPAVSPAQGAAEPGRPPGLPPPPARLRPRRSIPGRADRADSRAQRPPREHQPGSARRSCPRPPAAAAALGAGRRGRCRRRLRVVPPRLPSRMSPEYSLRSLLLIIFATFSANASNWL